MKKLISILLCAAMLLSMAPVALADGAIVSVTMNGAVLLPDESGIYNISYANKDDVIIFVNPVDGVTITSASAPDGAGVVVDVVPDGSLFVIKLNKDLDGYLPVSYSYTQNDETVKAILPLKFDYAPVILESSHPLTDKDKYPGTFVALDDIAAAFELDTDRDGTMETYYMAPGRCGSEYPYPAWQLTNVLQPGEYNTDNCGIGFFVKPDTGEYQRIVNEKAVNYLASQFEDMSLTLSARPDENGNYPSTYPLITKNSTSPICPKCITLHTGVENAGCWVITASGTINGKTIKSELPLTIHAKAELNFTPKTGTEIGVIEQINAFLNGIDPSEYSDAVINIQVPAGEHEGYIEVPAKLGKINVGITGDYTDSYGLIKLNTTIIGGVKADNGYTAIFKINFAGAGTNGSENSSISKTWKNEGSPNYKLDNVCIYGSAAGECRNCTFSGYDYVIYNTAVPMKGAANCVFDGNNTAVYYESDSAVIGSKGITGNVFANNEIAIHFAALNEEFPLTSLVISDNSFIDNKTDIRNDIKRRIYIPGNYFACTNEGVEEVRECEYLPVATGNMDKQVLYYPQADSRACESYIYDTSFYKHQPVVSVHFTKVFPVPQDFLDGASFTVMDGDTELAKVTFEAAAAQTFSLLRSAGAYDATVEVERSGDGKTITITLQDFPGGKTPTVSVPCDETWLEAVVLWGEETLEAEISDGYVHFVAPAGGTYIITATKTTADEDAEETPEVPDIPYEPVIPVFPIAPIVPNVPSVDEQEKNEESKAIQFDDVEDGAWYADAVKYVSAAGLMTGTGETVFEPMTGMSRAMFAKMLHNMEGNPANSFIGSFDDVSNDAWFADSVFWAAENGIIDGYGNGKFGPNDKITREQMAVVLYRYAIYKGYDISIGEDTNILSFMDAFEISDWAFPALQWACGAGIIDGKGDGVLDPKGTANRAEVAQMLMNFCEYVK